MDLLIVCTIIDTANFDKFQIEKLTKNSMKKYLTLDSKDFKLRDNNLETGPSSISKG